jgi:hypothetical protein
VESWYITTRTSLRKPAKSFETLVEKETRLANAYADGIMSEDIYRPKYKEVSGTGARLLNEVRVIEREIANKPAIPLEKLVDDVIKLVEDLEFNDRRHIIQQVVDKVIATKKEVTVCGFIPVLATEQVGLNGKYRHIKVLTQLPFELKLRMPSTDRGGRGYSDEYITEIEQQLYSA